MCVTGSCETRKVKVIWEKWCNYFKEVPSLWSHGYKTNESCLLSNHRKWFNCCHTINVMPYFSKDLGLLIITSWGFSCNWKDDTPSQQPYFVLQHSLASFSLSSLSSNIFWRCFWTDALTLLIQPSVRAQSSIHSCYILILSLGSVSGSSVNELTVWGVERDQDWYTEIHLQICTVTQTLKHLPIKNIKICSLTLTLKVSVTQSSPKMLDIGQHLLSYFLAVFEYDNIMIFFLVCDSVSLWQHYRFFHVKFNLKDFSSPEDRLLKYCVFLDNYLKKYSVI